MNRHVLLVAALAALAACNQPRTTPDRQVPGGEPGRGPAALARYGCGGCHVIPGVTNADGRVGPPLNDFADRGFVGGVAGNNPDSLVEWIRRPDHLNPGTAMPNLGVTEQDARDMAAYLYTLRRDRGQRLGR
jgi:cytochrome c